MAMYGYALKDRRNRELIAEKGHTECFFIVHAHPKDAEAETQVHDTLEAADKALDAFGKQSVPAITMDATGNKLSHTEAVSGHGPLHELIQRAQLAVMARIEAKGK